MIKILFICLGNICRSTMSEYVMKYLTDQAGLASEFYIDSAATSREEIGNGVHHGTRQKLKEVGIPCGNHRARQMMRRDYEEFDYIIGMDARLFRHRAWCLPDDHDASASPDGVERIDAALGVVCIRPISLYGIKNRKEILVHVETISLVTCAVHAY